MFYFGNPEDSALVYYAELEAQPGWPDYPRKHVDEMGEEELADALTHLNSSWTLAFKTGASQPILDVIESDYQRVFEAMCVNDRAFRKFVHTVGFHCPGANKQEAKLKYRAIAMSYMTR